jgi:Lon protease-like protein
VTDRLPLFPLGTVLLPGLPLPLHVFEARYRRLVRDLLDLPLDEPRHFGVVALREGSEVGAEGARALHDVGCTAELRQVEALDDGRYDIVTVGGSRFRLRGVDRSRSYLQGEVDWLAEAPGASVDDLADLAATVGGLFGQYRAAVLAEEDVRAEEDDSRGPVPDPRTLSYAVAAAMVLDLPDRQRLLAAPDDRARLLAEARLLRRETGLLHALPSLPALDLPRQPTCPN